MSTRTDWGYFKQDGTPVAVGDTHHQWVCPQRIYEPTGYEHPITGEWIDEGFRLQPANVCPMRFIGAKLERCDRCGIEFRYP